MSDTHLSTEEYKALQSKTKPSKHRNIRTRYGGRIYDSKKEAAYAAQLELQRRAGKIKAWIPQVSMPLSVDSYSRYVVDFEVITLDDKIRLIDVKGRDTPMSKLKRKEIFDHYGLEVEIV